MSQEIAVVGSPEFTTGFRLAGVRAFENVPDDEKDAALDTAVERAFDDEEIGIVVMRRTIWCISRAASDRTPRRASNPRW